MIDVNTDTPNEASNSIEIRPLDAL